MKLFLDNRNILFTFEGKEVGAMNRSKNPISGNSEYSVRKVGGYIAILLLCYLIVSYTIANDFKEVPSSYLISVDVIIAFYFMKNSLRDIKFTSKNSSNINATNNEVE